jgi:hypothetical protein
MNKTTSSNQQKTNVQAWTKKFIKKYKPALQELAKK